MHTPTPASPFVRVLAGKFRERAAQDGLTADSDIAERLGMHRITVWRLLNGEGAPGNSFIAAALHAFPGSEFSDFFEVTCDLAVKARAA